MSRNGFIGNGITTYGYRYFYLEGKAKLVHRWIMEKHLGRSLLPSEIVHHIDENKLNNHIDNLKIEDRSNHARHHSHVISVRPFSGEVIACCHCGVEKYYSPSIIKRIRKKGKYKCIDCYKKTKTWRQKSPLV